MVLLEAGKLPHGTIRQPVGSAASCAASTIRRTHVDHRRADHLHRRPRIAGAARAIPAARVARRRRPAGSPPRTAARSAATSPTLRPPPTRRRRCWSTTPNSSCVDAVARAACRYATFHTGYKQMDLRAGRDHRRASVCRARTGLARDYIARSARAARRRSRRSASPDRSPWTATSSSDVRIALGSVAPVVVRALQVENVLRGTRIDAGAIAAAEEALKSEIKPIDDLRSTAAYRLRVAANLLKDFLRRPGV